MMKKTTALTLLLLATSMIGRANETRHFEATYTATLSDVPAGLKELTVWIPLPVTRGPQVVSNVTIDSPYQWTRYKEHEFGNQYAVATIANPPAGELKIPVTFTGTRQLESVDQPSETKATAAELKRALRADRMVTLSPRVRKLADEITAGRTASVDQAHAIYDYLVSNMTYDKTVAGWGKGDTERACDIKKGNCTDFHSLFMSLARAKGIPTRFVIGFPLTAADGNVKGYHCWSEFYVKGKGWIPIDASDASKLKEEAARQFLFGHLDPARVQFTVGRDLVLTPKTAEPLNFFIYPHAEANGREVGTPGITLQFRDIAAGTAGSK